MKETENLVIIPSEEKTTLIISSSATDWRARRLSNNYGDFILTIGENSRFFPSVTHFMEMIKHPEHVSSRHFDDASLELDFRNELVVDTGVADDADGYFRGSSYNPPRYHRNRRLDYREVLKLCTPKAAKKVSSCLRPGRVVVYLFGKTYPYRSPDHVHLIKLAIRAKFEQNESAFRALLATEGLKLLYVPAKKDPAIFSAEVFCNILTEIREEAIEKRNREREMYANGHAGNGKEKK
ncbi:MAG: hypothetical protein HGA67_03440 [Candidatus Yonathbacteria bacterium]|nr:hypothetical protein [Candidatus Yonathbacteria bacterium]